MICGMYWLGSLSLILPQIGSCTDSSAGFTPETVVAVLDHLYDLEEINEVKAIVRELEEAEARGEAEFMTMEEMLAFQKELIRRLEEEAKETSAHMSRQPEGE
jgi:hypothetical protein